MSWIYLVLAGLLEMTWPLGLKWSQQPGRALPGLAVVVAGMSASLALLWLAQRTIPIGTAYAVWTGIGAAGTFGLGVLLFGDAATTARVTGLLLIVSGVMVLRLSHG